MISRQLGPVTKKTIGNTQGFKYLFSASNANYVKCYKMQFSGFFLLIFCFSLLKYIYYYNYRSHIPLQVAKLAKSAGVQILIFPTVNPYAMINNEQYLETDPFYTSI